MARNKLSAKLFFGVMGIRYGIDQEHKLVIVPKTWMMAYPTMKSAIKSTLYIAGELKKEHPDNANIHIDTDANYIECSFINERGQWETFGWQIIVCGNQVFNKELTPIENQDLSVNALVEDWYRDCSQLPIT